ncbi:TadE-like protein [Roseovarius litorisediminis]|uniref:TadE-like protein n=1 Tax=Roseovarius litorisediminis TaxID=1312363 RepID=A0A1Y5S407_9RHOB|nr:TadE/TadG family type IV pilus assembly protein [Roseovarius litorisediminis]SLN32159.1 TadE-like protein [Roseovarius litorisediminis]
MTRFFNKALGRFRKSESGTASVEFVLVFPVFLILMMFSIELGFVTLRHTLLERGLDMAARDIRLSTGSNPDPTHDSIKADICEYASLLVNCENNLRLEMEPADLRAFNPLSSQVKCTDKSEEVNLITEVTPGAQNQLMLLRACLKYDPLFPKSFLGKALQKDAYGQVAIVSLTAFVQEPL